MRKIKEFYFLEYTCSPIVFKPTGITWAGQLAQAFPFRYLSKLMQASFILLSLSVLFISCEKLIDINLNEANPNIVIEANLTDRVQQQVVKISQTKAFSEDNTIVPIKNANILVSDDKGNQYPFTEVTSGNYLSSFFAGITGRKYTIQVKVNSKIYTASSIMPQRVILDSLTVTNLTLFGNSRKYVQVNFMDPPNIANQYNYVIIVNDTLRNAYYVDNDRFNDGKMVINTIFTGDPELVSGDKIRVDFQCIDNNVYRYFFALSQISGNGGPPTAPSNPDSNFSNGALGYFSAHTLQRMNITLK